MQLGKGDALIIVDVQNDFLPGGALAVPNGDEIIPVLNGYIKQFTTKGLPVFATRDWHPADHCSFKEQGGTWPPHCVAKTDGANLSKDLRLPKKTYIISKAIYADNDVYSGFGGTNLHAKLTEMGIKRVFIGGLATDYCIKSTVLDALNHGYQTHYLRDACRAVNVNPEDGSDAEKIMLRAGAHMTWDIE
jgi:nicotinamidase/pyrazinamidase